ncbi:MAG: OmpA family protein [Deltaproteobacteria bacterium]|nr:OmpA family protein [Deltaproteobacteria bacterium]
MRPRGNKGAAALPRIACGIAAIVAAAIAAAQEQEEDAALPAGAKRSAVDLQFRAADLEARVGELAYLVTDLGGKPQALAQGSAELQAKVEALQVEETETEIRIQLSGDILFDFDKATLRPEAESVLERVAEMIRKHGKPMIRIDGFTDSKGSDSYNLTLSQRRADSVKQWLVAHRATGGVLSTRGWGEARPVAPNENPDGSDDPAGRQQNRRVEITIKKL